MPFQQNPQRVITGDDLTGKSVQITAMTGDDRGNSTSLANILPDKKPALMVSHSSLTFAKTSPGRPTFLVLTISQQQTNTPVTITTDEPDYFQLATDDRPVFSPNLTFIPSSTGTYVHIRYAANKMGSHKGKLVIETPYKSQALILEGSSWSLLPALNTPSLSARITKPAHVDHVSLGNWRVWAMSIAVGLALTGYFYRSQLFPGVHSDRSLTRGNKLPASQLVNNKQLKTTEFIPTGSSDTQKVKSNQKQKRKKRSTRSSLPDSLKEERSATPAVSAVQKPIFTPETSFQDDSHQANSRPRRKTVNSPSSGESELEHVLNQKVRQK